MLDLAMQQFAGEMQAKPRPRRASTRRAEQIDNSSSAGRRAQGPTLAELARSYHVGKSTISRATM